MYFKKHYLLLILFFLGKNIILAQKKAAIDSGFFRSYDHTNLFYKTFGNGFPVVLLHGFIVNSKSWEHTKIFQTLIDQGFKVILIDLRGNGRSDKPHDDEAYMGDAEAKDVKVLTEKLKIKFYDLVGYSRGSIIATRLLLMDQKHIHKAAIGGMGTDFMNPNWDRRLLFYHALAYDTVKELHELVKNIDAKGLDRKALSMLQKHQPTINVTDIHKIKTPVLVIRGAVDYYSISALELAHYFPKGECTIIPGDHDGALISKDFAEKVLQFFK